MDTTLLIAILFHINSSMAGIESFALLGNDDDIVDASLPSSSDKEPPTFPSDYFNDKKRPQRTVYAMAKQDGNSILAKKVRNDIKGMDLDLRYACGFMWAQMKEIRYKPEENWTANDIVVGTTEQELTPCDLLEGKIVTLDLTSAGGNEVTESEKWGLFWSLIGAHRLMKIKGINDNYMMKQRASIEDKLGLPPFYAKNINDVAIVLTKILYLKIII